MRDFSQFGNRAMAAANMVFAECRDAKLKELKEFLDKKIYVRILTFAPRPPLFPEEFLGTLVEITSDNKALFKGVSAAPPSNIHGLSAYEVDIDYIDKFQLAIAMSKGAG